MNQRFARALLLLAAFCAVSSQALAAGSVTIAFVGHGSAFSRESVDGEPLDPQVFVEDPGSPGGLGPEAITHAEGLRAASLSDPGELPLHDARGGTLGFTLEKWLAARGSVALVHLPDGHDRAICTFTKLIAFGTYTLLLRRPSPVSYAPLDGDGSQAAFAADANGTAALTIVLPEAVPHDGAIVLVYDSDGEAHGVRRGDPGLTSHDQLVAQVP
jgi:hypothetical protein